MKRFLTKPIALIMLLLAFTVAGCGIFGTPGGSGNSGDGKIRVMLEQADGLIIRSASYVDIEAGGMAVFEVGVQDGYAISDLSNGLYDETTGRIILSGARYPTTLKVSLRRGAVSVVTPGPGGETPTPTPFATDDHKETLIPGETPPDETEIPTPDISEVITPTPEPTPLAITLSEPKKSETLLPGEDPSRTEFKIVYHANGGSISGTDSDVATAFFPRDFYTCPNALPDTGYFVREGYMLAGYTENEDGTGEFYGPGWNIIPPPMETETETPEGSVTPEAETPTPTPEPDVTPSPDPEGESSGASQGDPTETPVTTDEPESGLDETDTTATPEPETTPEPWQGKEVYCLWVPYASEEDFDYEIKDDFVIIKEYKGTGDTVVIPEKIEGLKVLMIDDGAFKEKPVTEVYVPKYVEVIGENAFKGCDKLETLFLSDSVISMDDTAFDSCENLKTLNMLAVRNPAYTSSVLGTGSAVKYERLMTVQGRKLIHVSGSSGLFGIDSDRLKERLGEAIDVINLGLHASFSASFMLDTVKRVAGEDDVVIFAPEMNGYQCGLRSFNTTMWQCLEGSYDAIAAVDISSYTNVFSTFADFNGTRTNMPEKSYRDHHWEINTNGDLSYEVGSTTANYKTKQDMYLKEGGTMSFVEGVNLLKNYGKNLNRRIKEIRELGCEVLFSFAPIDRCCLTEASGGYHVIKKTTPEPTDGTTTEEPVDEIKLYEETIGKYLDAVVISKAEDSIFNPRYFWNSEWHVTGEGRKLRTARLANDVNAYFVSLEEQGE
ncbi:MAG: leucine-rich repeat protein [Clostridia bacterium]|nr:leucine-rich repeat protein [Clostridia bacterium]